MGVPGDGIMVGTVYNLFHEEYPTDEDFRRQVDVDIPAIAAAHLTDVMIFPMSQWDPATKSLRWDRTDYLVRKLEENHLRFVPILLKEEQCSYYFPIWKFQELGLWDAYARNDGNPNNRENVDFADPRVFPLVKQYLKAVIERYGHSPALSFYNVWNEPHYSATAPHVVERFRGWLKQKYGTLAALRRAWGDDYTDWSQVSPFLNDDWNSSMPGIDWALFRSDLQGELLAELSAWVRELDPRHPVNANPVGTPFANFAPPGGYNADNWEFPPHVDFAGASYYPDAWAREQGLERAPRWFHDLSFSVFRSAAAGREFVLTELYTNARSGLTLGGYLDAATARTLAWTALANDCKGMIYWKWQPFMRGRQSLGRGLVRLDGRLAPRGEAVKEFAGIVRAHGALLREAHLLPSDAGIIVDMVGLEKTLLNGEARTQTFMYRSIAGVFRALDQANLPVDFLRADRGLTLVQLRRYKVLFLPFQIVMRRDLAAILQEYVRGGGVLIADARTATIDELDYAYAHNPGAGLAGLFGAERVDWIGEPRNFRVRAGAASGWVGEFDAVWFREQLRVAPAARVLATFADNGEPAIVENRVGAGRALLCAFPLGGSRDGTSRAPIDALIAAWCAQAGAVAPAGFESRSGSQPLIRVHARGDERLIYLVNDTELPDEGTVSLPAAGADRMKVEDLVTERSLPATATPDRLLVPVSIPARSARVLHVVR